MEAKLLGVASPAIFSTNYSCISKPNSFNPRQSFQNCNFRCFNSGHFKNSSFQPVHASAASIGLDAKRRIDESDCYTLDGIRSSLIRQEDSIIFSLVERAQYCYNADTYDPNAFWKDGFQGSFVEFMLRGTEALHAQAGRYKSPDEHPFFPEHLPEPILPPLQYPQALSKRIHYGKFVAEAKFRASPDAYETAIKKQDKAQLMDLLTYPEVEDVIVRRVEMKTRTYAQEVTDDDAEPVYKIKPSLVADLYGTWIMPLTKEVQVEYLLRRLD
ncbi:chorismate mutase 1, chloroplastic isoform X2 [Daucus carota subsp. sativus]|uniref:chorismate mutase 1, chloroplastic isoform X2 n=1 Tax=Daucus carota subsp. sativus TaxID=79200 RepID=UPI003083637C